MPDPTTALLPHARRFALGFGTLLVLACVVVLAASALAQSESPLAKSRSDPIADARASPTGVAGQGDAAAARPADAGPAPVADAQGSLVLPAAHGEGLRQIFLLLLALLALRPVLALVSAFLRHRRERTD